MILYLSLPVVYLLCDFISLYPEIAKTVNFENELTINHSCSLPDVFQQDRKLWMRMAVNENQAIFFKLSLTKYAHGPS